MRGLSTRSIQRRRRFFAFACAAFVFFVFIASEEQQRIETNASAVDTAEVKDNIRSGTYTLAIEALGELAVRERIDRAGYSRNNFSPGWATVDGCDMRNRILQRDLSDIVLADDNCTVLSGILEEDPFSGKRIVFERGPETSGDIHIEHIVAVSDAWQKGAQDLSYKERHDFYNDPLNLIAIDGPTNMKKGDKDASDWMPIRQYRCRYVARQIAIKLRYDLWLDHSEHRAMKQKLGTCPLQVLPLQKEND